MKWQVLSVLIVLLVAVGCSVLPIRKEKIVFESYRDDDFEIYSLLLAEGSVIPVPQRVSDEPGLDLEPTWQSTGCPGIGPGYLGGLLC